MTDDRNRWTTADAALRDTWAGQIAAQMANGLQIGATVIGSFAIALPGIPGLEGALVKELADDWTTLPAKAFDLAERLIEERRQRYGIEGRPPPTPVPSAGRSYTP